MILIKFHFIVVFLSVLADDALIVGVMLRFGLVIQRLDQLLFIDLAIFDFDEVQGPEIGDRRIRPLLSLRRLDILNSFDFGLFVLLLAEVPFGNGLLPKSGCHQAQLSSTLYLWGIRDSALCRM